MSRPDQPAASVAGPARRVAEAYDPVAKLLHWGMAIAIFGLIVLGFYMRGQPVSLRTFQLFDLHKSLGLLMLGCAVLRLVWKHIRPGPPVLTRGSKPWELLLARVVHVALYALMIGVPVLGWLGASASGLPMTFFGLRPIPALIGSSETLQDAFFLAHEIGIWLLLGAVTLHVGGALKRHFVLRDATLVRMLPFGGRIATRGQKE